MPWGRIQMQVLQMFKLEQVILFHLGISWSYHIERKLTCFHPRWPGVALHQSAASKCSELEPPSPETENLEQSPKTLEKCTQMHSIKECKEDDYWMQQQHCFS